VDGAGADQLAALLPLPPDVDAGAGVDDVVLLSLDDDDDDDEDDPLADDVSDAAAALRLSVR
jgi:hypothetical protein